MDSIDVQKKILTFGLILTLVGRLLCPKDYLKVYTTLLACRTSCKLVDTVKSHWHFVLLENRGGIWTTDLWCSVMGERLNYSKSSTKCIGQIHFTQMAHLFFGADIPE